MNSSDRRRVVLASVFTLVALPALWALNRDTSAAGPNVGAAGMEIDSSSGGTAPSTTAYQPDTPLFVGGDDTLVPPGVIDVNVPPAPGANEAIGKASFHRYAGLGVAVCTTMSAPDGAKLTVTNLDNGQTTTCTNTLGMALPAGSDVVLNTAVYVLIGDLADAPIPVRLSW